MIHVYRCLHCRVVQTVINAKPGPLGPSPVPCSCGAPLVDLLPVDRLNSFDEWTGMGRFEVPVYVTRALSLTGETLGLGLGSFRGV